MKFKVKINKKSKLETVILVILITLSMTSFINIDTNFSKANQEVEKLNTSAEESMPIIPKYEYVYENDFDYSYHYTQITSDFYEDDAVVVDGIIGVNNEWSQDATDADNLTLKYFGVLNRGAGLSHMKGIMVVESQNTFEKRFNPNLGVYIDWSIDLDITFDGIDPASIRPHISLSIIKSNNFEELVKIENLNLQEGTFYLADFDQYICDDGKIKFALGGYIDGTTLWYYEGWPWVSASIEIKGLRVVQEIKPPEYKYVNEYDFDYSTHSTQLISLSLSQIIQEDLIGEDTEWSQNPTDADNLQLNYIGGFSPWAGTFYMHGAMVVESHNTFEKHFNPSLGVYIDWSIALDIIASEGIDLGSIQSQISLSIYKSNDFEELVMIGDLNHLEGTFYLANFNQYIWDDGKIRLKLSGLTSGFLLNPELSWIYASIKIKGLRVVQEIKPPEYNYAYNDFDYSTHSTQLISLSLSHIIQEELIGEDTEWSQNPTDADDLQLNYIGGFSPWAGIFYMHGAMVIESHNTFEKHYNPSPGVYIDWSIALDIIASEGIDLGSIQSQISLGIYKSNDFEELVMIGDLNQLEGTFYLANFNQYIWDDGKIRLKLSGLTSGFLLNPELSWISASIKIKGLEVRAKSEKRTLILVHGFSPWHKCDAGAWWTYIGSLEFKKAYDKIIVISYLYDYCAYRFSKNEYGVWQQDPDYDHDIPDTNEFTSIKVIAAGLALYIMRDRDYVGDNVDIICHSMGGLVTRYMIKHNYSAIQEFYASFGRNFRIHNICMIATPNHGVWYAWAAAITLIFYPLPQPTQIAQMASDGPFITDLNDIGVIPGTEIPLSGISINWFTYRSGIEVFAGMRHDTIVEMDSVPLSGATNKGIYNLLHGDLIISKMMSYVVFNDIFKPPDVIQAIFNEATPGTIIEIEDLKLEEGTLRISLPPEIASDIDQTSVYIEIDSKYKMNLIEGTTDTYEVELPLAARGYSFLITANDLDGGSYQISGYLKILPDVTSPIITFLTPVDGLITNQDVTLTYTVSDDYSSSENIDVIGPESGTIYNSEGSYEIEITAIDEVGNDVTETISFIIDRTVPEIDLTFPIDGLITNEDVELVYTVSDDTSAPADIDVIGPESGTTYSSEGFHEVTLTAIDEAGNIVSETISFIIDRTVPEIDLTFPIDGLITNEDVELVYTVSDDTSAPADIDVIGPESGTTYSSEGFHEVTLTATDEAGNIVSETISFIIDRTVPEIDITFPIDGLITNEDVELVYTVNDDESAPADIDVIGPESGTIYSSEGFHYITITATDEAGNIASISLTILIDKTAPEIDITSPIDGLITNQNVELIYTVCDDTSAPANIDINGPQSGTTYSSEGFYEITIIATDEAGNTFSKTISFIIDKTDPVIDITSPIDGLITNQDVELIYTVSDDTSAPADIDVIGPESGTQYTSEGLHFVEITATDEAGNIISETVSFIIDKIKPETSIIFGVPHLEINNIVHLMSTTPIELLTSDFSIVTGTFYKISNDTFDSGFIPYEDKFSLDSLILYDIVLYEGEYKLHYYSIDIAGNEEDPKYETIVLDNSPPTLSWEFEGAALQDGIQFEIEAGDATGVDGSSIVVSIRELNGPIVANDIPGQYVEGLWQADEIFDTTTLPDGYYELVIDASDALGLPTTEVFSFSIRNWAVLVLLPSTESNKAGRTMPIKFSLRVVAAVDPNMPFVVNQELDIFVTDTTTGKILQHSTYGSGSWSYRINELSEHYITNFKTHKKPTIYLVSIYRKDFSIGDFSFATVK